MIAYCPLCGSHEIISVDAQNKSFYKDWKEGRELYACNICHVDLYDVARDRVYAPVHNSAMAFHEGEHSLAVIAQKFFGDFGRYATALSEFFPVTPEPTPEGEARRQWFNAMMGGV